MPNKQLIERSIEIAAPPAAVWAIISDLKRMGEWSPQCRSMVVLGSEVKQGTRTININGQGRVRWPTNAQVVVFEPERKLAFRILENRTVWSYELAPTANGTRVTESRRAPDGVSKISNLFTENVLGGTGTFEVTLGKGIRRTLERIKAEAENPSARQETRLDMAGLQPLETSVDIAATPEEVWSAVSDLKAMKRRSPEVAVMRMFGAPEVGQRGINLNKRKGFWWPTTTRITRWKPPSLDGGRAAMAFHVFPTDVEWSYELEPTASGTKVTERRTALPDPSLVVRLTARWGLGGADNHDVELLAGMDQTLAAIKAEVES